MVLFSCLQIIALSSRQTLGYFFFPSQSLALVSILNFLYWGFSCNSATGFWVLYICVMPLFYTTHYFKWEHNVKMVHKGTIKELQNKCSQFSKWPFEKIPVCIQRNTVFSVWLAVLLVVKKRFGCAYMNVSGICGNLQFLFFTYWLWKSITVCC